MLSQSHPTLARWKEGFLICETPDSSGCVHICQTKVLNSWLGCRWADPWWWRGAKLSCEVSPDPVLSTDPQLSDQVVLNLTGLKDSRSLVLSCVSRRGEKSMCVAFKVTSYKLLLVQPSFQRNVLFYAMFSGISCLCCVHSYLLFHLRKTQQPTGLGKWSCYSAESCLAQTWKTCNTLFSKGCTDFTCAYLKSYPHDSCFDMDLVLSLFLLI